MTTPPHQPPDLGALRRLMNEASVRPWSTCKPGHGHPTEYLCVQFSGGDGFECNDQYTTLELKPADAKLIVAAMNALPHLLARAEAADRAERELNRRKGNAVTRLHNLCEALEERADESPFTREEWDRIDKENVRLQQERDEARAAEAAYRRHADTLYVQPLLEWGSGLDEAGIEACSGEVGGFDHEKAMRELIRRAEQERAARAETERIRGLTTETMRSLELIASMTVQGERARAKRGIFWDWRDEARKALLRLATPDQQGAEAERLRATLEDAAIHLGAVLACIDSGEPCYGPPDADGQAKRVGRTVNEGDARIVLAAGFLRRMMEGKA